MGCSKGKHWGSSTRVAESVVKQERERIVTVASYIQRPLRNSTASRRQAAARGTQDVVLSATDREPSGLLQRTPEMPAFSALRAPPRIAHVSVETLWELSDTHDYSRGLGREVQSPWVAAWDRSDAFVDRAEGLSHREVIRSSSTRVRLFLSGSVIGRVVLQQVKSDDIEPKALVGFWRLWVPARLKRVDRPRACERNARDSHTILPACGAGVAELREEHLRTAADPMRLGDAGRRTSAARGAPRRPRPQRARETRVRSVGSRRTGSDPTFRFGRAGLARQRHAQEDDEPNEGDRLI